MSVLTLIPKKKKAKPARVPARSTVTVPRYMPVTVPSPHRLPERLAQKLSALSKRFRSVHGTRMLARYLCAAVMLVTVQMFLDWLVDLSLPARAVILGGEIWLLVYFLRKQFLPLFLHPPNEEACALMVEKHWPKFRGRLIAAVQLGKPNYGAGSPELVRAVQQQAEAQTIQLDFGEMVPTRPMMRYSIAAAVLMALFVGIMFVYQPGSLALLERVFLLPAKVPRKTEVICLSGNLVIPAGNSVLLEAQARGVIPSHGLLTMVDSSGRIQEVTLDREPDHSDRYSLRIDSVPESIKYTIRLNDGTSGEYRVKTVPRPNVVSIECTQIYPAYTGLPNTKRTVGNLALLAGSHLQIHATTNSNIVKASLKLVGLDKEQPLTVSGSEDRDLAGEITIPTSGLTGFSIHLTNQAGVSSGDETEYRIDLIPDRPPTIQLTFPEEAQELDTLRAKVAISYAASDDFGLAKIALCYRTVLDQDVTGDTTGTQEPKRIEMDLGQTKDRLLNFQGGYLWDLSAVQPSLAEGTTVEYWIEARDNNDVTGPGISESEHHTIKIVSEMEKKADVMNRLTDKLSNLREILDNEARINANLSRTIQNKPNTP